jgi:tape measure domain-containing protein
VFAVSQIKDFITHVATVRGEFQQLEIAFKTMLGSAGQADVLMTQLVKTAATTPFGLKDIGQAAKQLLAYGVAANDVNSTLIRLGDIAAGLSIPINDLAYLYGTTMVQGRLYTQDLNQFLGRGIPLMEELAKQFGVAENQVKQLVEDGKVGFPEVQKALRT